MLHEAEKTVEALESGRHILPRCMHSDIHEFVGQVCQELCMLYPGASANHTRVLRIMKQHLEQIALKQTKTQTSTAQVAQAQGGLPTSA